MIQITIHGRAKGLLALLLLALSFAPFDLADDYSFLFWQEQGATRSVCALSFEPEISEMIAANELDSHHNCSCLICMITILEIASRAPLLPKAPEELGLFSEIPAESPYNREVFHPPRA